MLEYLTKLHSAAPFKPSKRFIKECFHHFNQKVFDNELEIYKSIRWLGTTSRFYGRCHGMLSADDSYYWILEMSYEYPSFMVFVTTLLHEMVHAYQWMKLGEMNHGVSFFKWKRKIERVHFTLERKIGKRWRVLTHK
jgi:hypothetical protein